MINSENKNVKCAIIIVKVISSNLYLRIYGIDLVAKSPINPPITKPKIIIERNEKKPKIIVPNEVEGKIWCKKLLNKSCPPKLGIKIDKITKNKAKAVPSLKRDSPSKIKVNLFGAHISLNKAKTETGSVAEIRVPKAKRIIKGTEIPNKFKIK